MLMQLAFVLESVKYNRITSSASLFELTRVGMYANKRAKEYLDYLSLGLTNFRAIISYNSCAGIPSYDMTISVVV